MTVNGINVKMWRRKKFQILVLTLKNNVQRILKSYAKAITNQAVSRLQNFANTIIAQKRKNCFKNQRISINLESSFLEQIAQHFKFKTSLSD